MCAVEVFNKISLFNNYILRAVAGHRTWNENLKVRSSCRCGHSGNIDVRTGSSKDLASIEI
jgi:hypothetical protein